MEIDNSMSFPVGWNQFISHIKENHNLIIKKSNKYYCTNCKTTFLHKKLKINQFVKCPNCKKEFLIKSSKLKKYEFVDNLGLIDKYDNYFVIRYLELKSYYDGKEITSDLCEYGRKIYNNHFEEKYEIINDHLLNYLGGLSIIHDGEELNGNWKYFNSYYKSLGNCLIYYPGNIKKILKNTIWEYSHLWILAKKEEYFDISYLMRNYTDSIELLIKLKLYKLALCPKTFSKKGSFEKRFGLDKTFLPYMQKHNLNLNQLYVLRYSKIKDIRLIKFYEDFNIQRLENYKVDLKKLKLRTNIDKYNFEEYVDYLRMSNVLGYDLKDSNVLFPKDIIEAHNRVLKLYKMKKDKKINDKIKQRFKSLKNNIYKNEKYVIFPAKDMETMIDESKQQNNCVKTYCEDYANKVCDIYFMRLVNNPRKSLVTVEVINNKVVQQRTKNNQDTTKEQKMFLENWEKILN